MILVTLYFDNEIETKNTFFWFIYFIAETLVPTQKIGIILEYLTTTKVSFFSDV